MSDFVNCVVLSRLLMGELRDNLLNLLEYTYVAASINIAPPLLETESGCSWLTDLAVTFDSTPVHPSSANAVAN